MTSGNNNPPIETPNGTTTTTNGTTSPPRQPRPSAPSDSTSIYFGIRQTSSTDYYTADNPMPHLMPEGDNATPLEVLGSTATDKLIIVMVGLPATGKTHIAKRICRYLNFFLDIPSQIFNVGDYRRQLCGAQMPASFYDPSNVEGVAQRTMACNAALSDMMEYMKQDGVRVAVYDATNSTRVRRKHLVETLEREGIGAKKMFLESICDNEELLEENIRTVKLLTPDYRDVNPEDAVSDFKQRRDNYLSVYETVDECEGCSFIKVYDCRKFIVNNIRGYLPLKIVHFVMNLHTLPRTFYFTRHGQSEYNVLGKIGGDAGLSKPGIEYARRLAVYAHTKICRRRQPPTITSSTTTTTTTASLNDGGGGGGGQQQQDGNNNGGDNDEGEQVDHDVVKTEVVASRLWTSTLRRTKETVQFMDHPTISHVWDNGDKGDWVQMRPMARRNLDELYAGACDGMTYKEIEEVFPEEFARRQKDKLSYRYPRGESYMDVILRLEPLAHEMERTREPILIVGHQGILRILYAYFMGLSREEAPYVSIPLNTIIQLTPHAYGCHEKRICLMHKEEMLVDGQDEPVTSMPVPSGVGAVGTGGVVSGGGQRRTLGGGAGVALSPSSGGYCPNDPVMNAPSC